MHVIGRYSLDNYHHFGMHTRLTLCHWLKFSLRFVLTLLWRQSVQYPEFVSIFNQLISVYTFNGIIMLLYCFLVCMFVSVQVPIYHHFIRYNQERLDLLNQRAFWNENYTINSKFQLIANLYVLKVISKMLIACVF